MLGSQGDLPRKEASEHGEGSDLDVDLSSDEPMSGQEDSAKQNEREPAFGGKSVRRNPVRLIVYSSDSEIDRDCDKTLRSLRSAPD